jgi:hypothetical protein
MRPSALFYIITCLTFSTVGSFVLPGFPHSSILSLQKRAGPNIQTFQTKFSTSRVPATAKGRRLTGLQMGIHNVITYPVRVAILGGGNFGLCLACVLGNKNIPVTLLVRKENVATTINTEHHHPTFLSDVQLPLCVTATTDPALALRDATFIIHAVPVQFSRAYLRSISSHVGINTPIICTSKGIEAGTLTLMKDILYQELGAHRELAFLSGPSFAREIATGLATAVVIASVHEVRCRPSSVRSPKRESPKGS